MGHVQRYDFIPENQTDSQYDFDYRDKTDTGFSRGGHTFNRPIGWYKIALKVKGKYADGDDWFGAGKKQRKDEKDSLSEEWPVSYHGTRDHNNITSIILNGYDMTKNVHSNYGKGIYSSPYPNEAEGYAETFTWNGKKIKAMFMNRVNMSQTKVVNNSRFFVTTNDQLIRPIAVLIKEV